jgi:EAL domain-containing protein (putative c-di-GMP-specific phosphodiesterase class I)
VSLRYRQIVGFEALLRWQHPARGLVSPGTFIELAEETGLIIPIGWWVLREACRQIRMWQTRFPTDPPLTISVNFSGKQLKQPHLVERIERMLQETSLDPHSLKLEITENAVMDHTGAVIATLSQLKALGIQIQLDDFGTGYSSLSYLQHFPIDTIKIDRSFISQMGVNGNGPGIVQTIVVLAHELAMNVIAEGVETGEQLAQLEQLECEYGQGYLIARPLDGEAAEALIAEAFADRPTTTRKA